MKKYTAVVKYLIDMQDGFVAELVFVQVSSQEEVGKKALSASAHEFCIDEAVLLNQYKFQVVYVLEGHVTVLQP